MRITGGYSRGITICAPKGNKIRPATDKKRESLFSSLGDRLEGARILDLFAGTGAYGLEALSRGAAEVKFVEWNRACAAVLEKNLEAVKKSGRQAAAEWMGEGEIVVRDVFHLLSRKPGEGYDMIFADPPYEDVEMAGKILFRDLPSWLNGPHARLIFEVPADYVPSETGWKLSKALGVSRRGSPQVRIYQHVMT